LLKCCNSTTVVRKKSATFTPKDADTPRADPRRFALRTLW
jgi:hypothetical protein